MSVITERPREKRLEKYKLNIRTEFYDGGKRKVRNTDDLRSGDIEDGIILNKQYYSGTELLHRETDFSPAIHYSYIAAGELSKQYVCGNCGASGTGAEFSSGCPCCGTYYNMEYTRKQLGGQYHGNYLVNNKKKFILTAVLLLLCVPLSVLYFRASGRTFTVFDVLKGVLIGLMAAVFLFFVIFSLSFIVHTITGRKKYERQEKLLDSFRKELEKDGMTLGQFFNNLNSELASHFFDDNRNTGDVIDYDPLDYDDFYAGTDENGRRIYRLSMPARIIRFSDGKLTSKNDILRLTLLKTEEEHNELHPGMNIIKCPNCSASINAENDQCEYCGTKIKFMQKLYLSKVEYRKRGTL